MQSLHFTVMNLFCLSGSPILEKQTNTQRTLILSLTMADQLTDKVCRQA